MSPPRRVTFSRNHTISLSRTCAASCGYCAFKTKDEHLWAPDQVQAELGVATRRRAKELLILTGEDPGHHAANARRLQQLGFDDFVGYVIWVCEQALGRGLLPHTNLGVLSRTDLQRLRDVTASQGLMLESVNPDLVPHRGSPAKDPARRLAMIRTAGELRIPFTSGLLVGIGESRSDRLATLDALAEVHAEHGHLQEIILQNFVPHGSYAGREPAELADAAAQQAWRTGVGLHPAVARQLPRWAQPVSVADMVELVGYAQSVLPGVGIQVPPNLADWWPELVAAGATDLGGLSANGDHISPEHPFPSPAQVRRQLRPQGIAVSERLCAYGQYLAPEWQAPAVLDVISSRFWSFIPRGTSGRGTVPFAVGPSLVSQALDRVGEPLTLEQTTALLMTDDPAAIEAVREAADMLRADLNGDDVTFVVNRNLNVSNICTVGCAFCGFGQSRRSPDAYTLDEDELRARVREALSFGATELCIQSGIHPDWTLADYERWLQICHDEGPHLHLHAYSPMEISHMAEVDRLPLPEVLARLRTAGLGSIPGTAAEVLHDGVRQRISPNKLPAARWVDVVEAAHRAGIPSTSTVMFGHIEEPWELAHHLRVLVDLQARTGGISEFVPLSFVPFQTLLGRTHGISPMAADENLRHTAVFRLALGRSIRHLQASWVKLGLDVAVEALRWGVDDLGGTLMEESITRMAGGEHGVRLEPGDLIAAAHRAGRPAVERSTLYRHLARHPLPEPSVL
jgi:FO synthase